MTQNGTLHWMRREFLGAIIMLFAVGAGTSPARPSAIQRATGVLRPTAALQPLDSMLRVRVLDERGAELSGVTVEWTLANAGDGAALRVVNAVTDSLGLSRAAFTPGRSANPQSAIAAVKDVGRIPFTVTIPAAQIRVVPPQVAIWSADDTVLTAELRDRNGVVLTGGAVSWATTDTTVARVTSDSSPRAPVRARLAGTTRVVAWVGDGKVRGAGQITVRPVIAGRFITADDGAVPPLRLEVIAGDQRDSLAVRDAAFTERVPIAPDADVVFNASPVDTSAYHDVAIHVRDARALQHLVIALVPKRYRIDAGAYRGQIVPIDAAAAMQRVGRSAPFWRLVPYSGTAPRKLLGWRDDDLPLRIAFDRGQSATSISAEDSVAFWQIAEGMERDIGRALFVPADLRADTTIVTVIRVRITQQSPEGHTFVSWKQTGDANDGLLRFARASLLRDSHVVTHELTHLLGFGHSGSWPTISQPSGGNQQRLTAEDVAYIQLAFRLRRLQEIAGALPGLPVLQR